MASLLVFGSAAASLTSNGLDLSDPDAGIADPVANLVPLDRNCKPGQTDVNTAAPDVIARAFGLHSSPTVRRIVQLRPWLRVADLTSVPGVAPARTKVVISKGCATPVTIPDATPRACTSDEQVDLQAASATKIRTALQVSKTTADAIVRQRPIPQDLEQIVAPRIPGLGPGQIKKWLAANRVCVTPAPTTFAGSDYRFVYPQHGAVISSSVDRRFALIIPPGIANISTFGRVTPVSDRDLPTADFHLYGTHSGEVAARLPDAGFGDPVVFHDASDGVRLSTGNGVMTEAGGTVVTRLASLSEASSSSVDFECLTGLSYSTFCSPTSSFDQLLLDRVAADGASIATQMNGAQDRFSNADGECIEASTFLVSSGSTPLGIVCSATTNQIGNESTWTFENVFAGDFLIFSNVGTPYFVDVTGGATPRSSFTTSPGPANNGTLQGPIARALADHGIVLPGHARNFVKHAGDNATTVTSTGANPGVLAVAYAVMNVADILGGVSDLVDAGEFVDAMIECVGILENNAPSLGVAKDILLCAASAAELHLQNLIDDLDGRTTAARRLKNAKGMIRRLAVAPALAEFGAAFVTNLLDGSSFNEQSLQFRHLLPPPPAPGSGGGTGTPVPGGGIDGSLPAGAITDAIIKLENGTYHAELTTGGDFVGHAILDVETYACLTRQYLVRDWLPAAEYLDHIRQNSVYEATCDRSIPEFSAPTGSRNFILRQLDGDSFHLGADGKVRPILDGNTYICLAQRVFVLDNRSDSEIASYPQAPIPAIATCM